MVVLPKEVAQQVLATLVSLGTDDDVGQASWDFAEAGEACFALRQALEAEQQAEPVRVATVTGVDEYGPMLNWHRPWVDMVGKHLYDGPQPARTELQPLTQEQIDAANALRAESVAWKHDCDALCMGIEQWIAKCPHCGKPRSTHPQLTQQPAISPGWKWVPMEPTDDMLSAWFRCARWARDGSWQEAYRDLLAAAPEAPATGLNLNCRSEQKRLATLWGFVPAQQPLTDERITEIANQPEVCWGDYLQALPFARAIERAHGIK